MAIPATEPLASVPTASPLPARRGWTLAGASLASFLLTLGDTALAVALPTLGRALRLGLAELEWVVNAYTLALGVLLLAGGWLTDRLGGRRVFVVGTGLYVAASLVAGVARTGPVLIAGRALQGASAALVLPATLALVAAAFGHGRRGTALGVWSGAGAAALAAGPLVGAVLTEQLGWAWVFLINVPLGLLGIAAAYASLPADRGSGADADVPGLAAAAAAVLAAGVALTETGRAGWSSPVVVGGLATAALAAAAFLAAERRRARPLLDPATFGNRRVVGANVVMLLSTAVMCSVLFFVSLYLQAALGYSPLATGAAFLPLTGLVLVVAPLSGVLTDRLGARAPATAGMGVLALGLLLVAERLDGGYGGLLAALAVVGIGVGLVTTPVTAAALPRTGAHDAGVAAGVLNTARMVGLTLGIALMGAIVAARWPGGVVAGVRDDLGGGLALAFRVNAGIALATAGVAAATLAGRRR